MTESERCPSWAHRMMAEELAKMAECLNYPEPDDCRGGSDCITEWCPYCYAKNWVETEWRRTVDSMTGMTQDERDNIG